MKKPQIVWEKKGEWDIVRFHGIINEEVGARLIQFAAQAGSRCLFNFGDVSVINSAGTRVWVLFLKDFGGAREIVLEDCPPVIVAQLNMLPSFSSGALVKSVRVPYRCMQCNHTAEVLVTHDQFPSAKALLKSGSCAKCTGPTEVVDESDYFVFAAN